jgi:prephenate dehydrogenase
VTRIAAGDTGLWLQILSANAVPVAEVLTAVAADLAEAASVLTGTGLTGTGLTGTGLTGTGLTGTGLAGDGDLKPVIALLDRGQAGVARIPGKHGGAPREFTVVQVLIPDSPGELARLFHATGAAGVNIEDVRIEHSPGLPVGVAELSVRPAAAARLLDALGRGGWPVRG